MGTTDRTAAERQRRRRIKLKAVEQENVTLRARVAELEAEVARLRMERIKPVAAQSAEAEPNQSRRPGPIEFIEPTPVRVTPGAGKITGGGTTAVRVSYTISDAEPNVSLPKDSRVYGPPRQRVTRLQAEEMLRRVNAGETERAVARDMGLAQSTVRGVVLELRAEMPAAAPETEPEPDPKPKPRIPQNPDRAYTDGGLVKAAEHRIRTLLDMNGAIPLLNGLILLRCAHCGERFEAPNRTRKYCDAHRAPKTRRRA